MTYEKPIHVSKVRSAVLGCVLAVTLPGLGQECPPGEGEPEFDVQCAVFLDCDDEHCTLEFEECIICTEQLAEAFCTFPYTTARCTEFKDVDGCGLKAYGLCVEIGEALRCFEAVTSMEPCCRTTCM